MVDYTTGRLGFWTDNSGPRAQGTTNMFGTWHHFAATRASGNLKIYIDGNQEDSQTLNTDINANTDVLFGVYTGDVGSANANYWGQMDEMRIYKGRALTAAEVSASYIRGLNGLRSNVTNNSLVMYVPFDSGFSDFSTIEKNGIVSGNTKLVNGPKLMRNGNFNSYVVQNFNVTDAFVYDTSKDNIINPLWKFGDTIGKCAMTFDGNGDYVNITRNAMLDFDNRNYSITFWIKTPSNALTYAFDGRQGNTGNYGYLAYLSSGILVFAHADDINTAAQGIYTSTKLNDNQWHHVALIRNDTLITKGGIFIDGVSQNIAISHNVGDASNLQPGDIMIGARYDRLYSTNGSIDEFMIFNRALSQSEIQSIYQRGISNIKSNITSGVVGSWGFENCLGDLVTDESGNKNTGVRVDAKWKEKLSWYKEGNSKDYGAWFDGENDLLNISSNADFNLADSNFTISAWAFSNEISAPSHVKGLVSQWENNDSSFTNANSWQMFNIAGLNANARGYWGSLFDGRYIYYPPGSNSVYHGLFARYDTLGDFTSSGSWEIYDISSLGIKGYTGGVFDGRYAYFTPTYDGSTYSGKVLRFDTQGSFTSSGSWTVYDIKANVNSAYAGFWGASFDGRNIYLIPYYNDAGTHGNVVKYDTTKPFTSASSWEGFNVAALNSNAKGYIYSVFDGRYLYLSPYHNGAFHGNFVRYDTHKPFGSGYSWTIFDLSTFSANAKGFWGASFDGRYVYLAPYHDGTQISGRAVRYDTTKDFSSTSSYEMFNIAGVNSGAIGFDSAVYDGKYVYYLPYNNGVYDGLIARYNTAGSFSSASSWSFFDATNLAANARNFLGGSFDGRYLYLTPYYNEAEVGHGRAIRYDTTGNAGAFKLQFTDSSNAGGGSGSPFGANAYVNIGSKTYNLAENEATYGWKHIVLTRNSTNISLYVNGIMKQSKTIPSGSLNPSNAPLRIGSILGTSGLDGAVNKVRIFNGKALNPSEIMDLYSRELVNADTANFDNDASLFAYYDFDTITNPFKDKKNRNNLSANGNAVVSSVDNYNIDQGIYGTSAAFNGLNQFVYINPTSDHNLQTFTIEGWMYPNYLPASFFLFEKTIAGSVNSQYSCFLNANSDYAIYFRTYNSGGAGHDISTSVAASGMQANKWNHIACVYDGANKYIYVNGVPITSAPYSVTMITGSGNSIIGAYGSPGAASYFTNGMIDEVRLYNRGLSGAEILGEYNSGRKHLQSVNNYGLVGYWGFNGASNYRDESDYANDGTGYNAVSNLQIENPAGGSGYSIYDQAGYFDPVIDYLNVTTDSRLSASTMTLENWVKIDSDGVSQDKYIAGKANQYWMAYNNPGLGCARSTFCFVIHNGAAWKVAISTTRPQFNKWYHLVGTFDGTTVKLYVNGALESSTPSLGAMNVDNTYPFNIGGLWIPPYSIGGAVDEVRYYNRPLTDSEINTSYYRGLAHLISNNTNGLAGYWNFDGDYKDYSINSLNTVVGYKPYLEGRSGTKDFPNRTFILGSNKGIDMIDASDNSLWMRFTKGGNANMIILSSTSEISSVAGLNGNLYTTVKNGNVYLARLNLKSEVTDYTWAGGRVYSFNKISSRNDGYIGFYGTPDLPLISSNHCNDVSVTVINNNTFTAVAGDGGITIINDSSGRGVSGTQESIFSNNLFLTDQGEIYSDYVQSGRGAVLVYRRNAQNILANYKYGEIWDYYYEDTITPNIVGTNSNLQDIYVTTDTSTVSAGSNTLYIATDQGATVIQEKQGDEVNGVSEHYVLGPGKVSGASVQLDGTGDYIDINTWTPPNDVSVDMWFRLNTALPDGAANFFIYQGIPWGSLGLFMSNNSGTFKISYDVDNSGTNRRYWRSDITSNPPAPYKWHHIVSTQSGPTGTPSIYLDGNALSVYLDVSAGTPSRISGTTHLGDAGGGYINGAIDEVRIYNRVLSGAEVTQSYNRGLQGLPSDIISGLLYYYPFDSNYSDMSGSANHGTKQGDTFLAYTIIPGTSSNIQSIFASGNTTYLGIDKTGIVTIDTSSDLVKKIYNVSSGALASNRITALAQGSVLYGTADGGAGTLEEDSQSIRDILGWVKTTAGWVWQKLAIDSIVTSGNQYNWSWRQYQYNSGRKTISGTQYNWSWVDE